MIEERETGTQATPFEQPTNAEALNDAFVLGHNVPTQMLPDQEYEATMRMRNCGSEAWAEHVSLHLYTGGKFTLPRLATNKVPLPPDQPLGPGAEVTIPFLIKAPSVAGSYSITAQMFNGDEPFGEPITVSISVGQNGAVFVSQSLPSVVTAGEEYHVVVVMRNSGATTWNAERFYRLGSRVDDGSAAPIWGGSRMTLPRNVVVRPGELATFRGVIRAPHQPGNYPFQWRLVQEWAEWFGEFTPFTTIRCVAKSALAGQLEGLTRKLDTLLDIKIAAALDNRDLKQPISSHHEIADDSRSICKIPDDVAARIDAVFARWDNKDSPGCALCYCHAGEPFYQRGYGLANIENEIPLTACSVFPAGSLSKQFIALLLLLLADAGKLDLDAPVTTYLPEFPSWARLITPRQLMHHTSGLRDEWQLLHLAGCREDEETHGERVPELLVRQEAQAVTPGEQFQYCQTGYTLLELIISRVSGSDLASFANTTILRPLNMASTRFQQHPGVTLKRRVSAYRTRQDGSYQLVNLEFNPMGEATLFTTAEDFVRWDRNFYEGEVGSRVLDEMQTRGRLSNGCRVGYAGGLMTGHKGVKTFEHSGHDHGCRSYYVRFVNARFSVMLFSNIADLNPLPLGHAVADIICRWQRKRA